MNIGFDCNPLFGEKKGIGWYLYNLLEKFSILTEEKDSFFLFWSSAGKGTPEIPPLLREKRKVIEKRLLPFPRTLGLSLSKIYSGFPGSLLPKLDLVHFANFTAFPIKKAKVITTVHDLVFQLFPKTVHFKVKLVLSSFFRDSLYISDFIITVSKSTERDLLNFYPEAQGKTRVIYQGVDHDIFKPKQTEKKKLQATLGTTDYILSLSTLEPRKNLITLLRAYWTLFKERGAQIPDLVLVGSKGWKMEALVEEFKNLPEKVRNKIKFPGYLPREILPGIFSSCRVFIFPSLYEGFGLPVLEAMACGAPVIASNSSSLPEVGGDAAIYVDPLDPEAFKMAIEEILDSPSKVNELKVKSLEQSKKFSWEKTARETLQLYKEALNSP